MERNIFGINANRNSREFISVKPSDEIVALYVLKEYQGYGIGKSLMNAVKDELSEKNILLFVLKGNEQAIQFYEHTGFSFTGESIFQDVSGGTIEELEMIMKRKTVETGFGLP